MDAERQHQFDRQYTEGMTPEDRFRTMTGFVNFVHLNGRTAFCDDGLATSGHEACAQYEQYYNERRAREARILPDGVAQ